MRMSGLLHTPGSQIAHPERTIIRLSGGNTFLVRVLVVDADTLRHSVKIQIFFSRTWMIQSQSCQVAPVPLHLLPLIEQTDWFGYC